MPWEAIEVDEVLVLNLLQKYPKLETCWVCDTQSPWIVSKTLRNLGDLPLHFGRTVPLVVVICNECGFTLLFNPVQLGMIEIKDGQIVSKRTTFVDLWREKKEERREK